MSIFTCENKFILVTYLVICYSKFTHQDENSKTDCTAKLIGKQTNTILLYF